VALPGSTDTTTIVLRIAGMQDALLRYGLPATSDKVVACGDPDHETFVSRLWPRAATRRPDAIICSNDLTAARLLRTLSRMGVSVPEDLRVASFDDVKYAELLNPPLTTIRQPYQALGRIAVATMLERIQKPDLPPRTILLNATLMIRESCGAHLKT
jgi:DNA-binding LacI/PurR family transcriptional regulator